jgi:hypothetical protein
LRNGQKDSITGPGKPTFGPRKLFKTEEIHQFTDIFSSRRAPREASDGGVKQTTTGEQANGTAINASYTAKYDGKEVQVTGNAPYDSIAIKQVNANTLTDERKKTGGPYKATGRTVVSNGGKTMTTTVKGTNADGKEFTQVFAFDKQ